MCIDAEILLFEKETDEIATAAANIGLFTRNTVYCISTGFVVLSESFPNIFFLPNIYHRFCSTSDRGLIQNQIYSNHRTQNLLSF
jgi:hypothetical protein